MDTSTTLPTLDIGEVVTVVSDHCIYIYNACTCDDRHVIHQPNLFSSNRECKHVCIIERASVRNSCQNHWPHRLSLSLACARNVPVRIYKGLEREKRNPLIATFIFFQASRVYFISHAYKHWVLEICHCQIPENHVPLHNLNLRKILPSVKSCEQPTSCNTCG